MDIKIFAKTIEESAKVQIEELASCPAYVDSKIRIMPDCHAGSGCTIGTTMTITDKITPNLVGVDIGCGMLAVGLGECNLDLVKIDKIIRKYIPHGFAVHQQERGYFEFDNLICKDGLNLDRAQKSLGTLGGGNHFIEISESENGYKYLIIHSGSRNIGNQVARFYQDIAIENKNSENKDLAYLEGSDMTNYLNDMRIMQQYATANRKMIAYIILEMAGLKKTSEFETIHNYIDFEKMILRKGAVSAEKDELLLIPINMRDGSLLCAGKGNEDWNYSAPHGAGRLMGRKEAKRKLDLSAFEIQMKGVYTTSVCEDTLDEAPDAYKPMSEIVEAIKDTADIIKILKPIYNFKSSN